MNIIIKDLKNEAFVCLKKMLNPKSIWIYVPALLAVLSVYIAYWFDAGWYLAKGGQETAALVLMSSVIFILIISTMRFKNTASLFFLVLAVNFLIREMDKTDIDIPYFGTVVLRTKGYIYVALAIMAVWGVWKEKKIIFFLNEYPILRTIFLGVTTTYFASQCIARRIFKHIPILPHEQHLHIPLEEVTENFAHTFFLALAFVILWYSFTSNKIIKNTDNQ